MREEKVIQHEPGDRIYYNGAQPTLGIRTGIHIIYKAWEENGMRLVSMVHTSGKLTIMLNHDYLTNPKYSLGFRYLPNIKD